MRHRVYWGVVVSMYIRSAEYGLLLSRPLGLVLCHTKKAEPKLHKTKVATGGGGKDLIGKTLLVGGEGVGARTLSVIVLLQAFERRLMQFVARVPIYPRSLLMLLVLLRPSPARCLSG